MVVGKGTYTDRSEAYPLDKKTLRKIALRSFMTGASFNGETGESIGWLWAIMPGLEKIHTNEDDLSLAMGHNLEYVNTGGYFSTFAMGVMLALEQQKADLETIRSVRTAAASVSYALSEMLFRYLLIPVTAGAVAAMAAAGSVTAAIIFFAVLTLIAVIMRFALITVGYAEGTKAVDKLVRNKEALKHAAQIAGVFMIGTMIVYYGSDVVLSLNYTDVDITGITIGMSSFFSMMPGIICIMMTWLVYHLLTKKGWSIGKCVLLIIILSVILGFFGLWNGISTAPVNWPWLS